MATLLYRLGHLCVRRRRLVLAAWIVVLVGVAIWSVAAQGTTTEALSIPGTESQAAQDLLSQRFPAQAGTTIRIAIEAPEGRKLTQFVSDAQLNAALRQVLLLPNVVAPADPHSMVTTSPDGRIAFIEIRFDKSDVDLPKDEVRTIIAATKQAASPVLKVAVSGDAVTKAVGTKSPPTELIGFVAAVIILLIAFGSVIAMGLPLLTALLGVVISTLAISVVSAYTTLSSVAPTLALMIGLAVGIDYALFIVTRHRAFHHSGLSVAESAARANATSGGAVFFAGGTVIIALAGLTIVGIPFLSAMGLCAAGAVAIAVIVALTLVPALLGFAGENIDKLERSGHQSHDGGGRRTRHVLGTVREGDHRPPDPLSRYRPSWLIVILALPLLAIRLGLPDDGSKPTNSTQRQAYDILADGFGAGFNGPLTVAVDLSKATDKAAALAAISDLAGHDQDVAVVAKPISNQAGDTAIIAVIPKSGPSSSATEDLVHRLRDGFAGSSVRDTGAVAYITGTTAANIDISKKLGDALPIYMAFVIGLTMLLLLVVFRSILVPIKAAIAILLSIGAALGVVVAIFQWGWLDGIIGVSTKVPIVSFVPLMMFGILFGLSMDYEVFILSRIREEFSHSDDPHGAVVTGLASSARVITAAALIMISVFGAFVLGDDVVIKMFGLGLAVAVLIDATVVRMVVVPAAMTLFDRAAWWLPRWLRRLPDLDVEGAHLLEHLETDTNA